LKEDTKPPSGYINARVVAEYNIVVWKKGQRGVKWVDEWEAVMAKAIRYNIAELSEGRWLRDFASQIRIVTDGFSDKLLDEATDPTLLKPQ